MPFPLFARIAVLAGLAVGVWIRDSFVSDTWWALRAGQDMWRTHHVLLTEQYSYTAHGAFWPNHEWLWQVLAYAVWHLGGAPALALANGALAVLAFALARPPGPLRRADAYALLFLGPLLLASVSVRPQVISMVMFVVVLRLVGRERWWPLPAVFLVWANLHGEVLIGVSVLGAAAVVAGLRAVLLKEWRRTRLAGPASLLAIAATLATPLGIRLWSAVQNSVGQSKRDGVGEWASSFHTDSASLYFWVAVVVCSIVILLRRRRLVGWQAQFLLATTVLGAIETAISARNMPFFALSALPLLIEVCRPAIEDGRSAPMRRRNAAIGVAIGLSLASLAAYALPAMASLGWRPVSDSAQNAIAGCPARVYTTYNSGGTLIWWTPSVPVFEDNREYPYSPQILSLGLLGSNGRPTDYQAIFIRYGIRCAAFNQDDGPVGPFLRGQGWKIAYRDSQWTVMTAPGTRLTSTP